MSFAKSVKKSSGGCTNSPWRSNSATKRAGLSSWVTLKASKSKNFDYFRVILERALVKERDNFEEAIPTT
jgi:hypothetical protein